ncbi:copper amine oxidase N-terminal domain-containing protein [Paenibacillus radicis (ex Xue et al. 2023)]|uniref:Copper amine oxidase N-terminal domain-containing protein n=1 Tax=Paenibacillus radicis (ex Xue et al. 2023) TaxID=2972489 RepID=A0ABT1YTZ0_9BACL|nr:copper amine oxidase N-terminal domain-containing protein [Paenibacillus radicis (ex Xue et al. 2023)]MCR8636664.1 copper amine oxidase N-terminal domain-containing protein [Paenibacillus radicis (ex Xue et al. 2023)]
MKRHKLYVGVLSIAMLLAGSVGVYAGSNLQEIKAYLNGDITFQLNGADWYPLDETGQKVLPITYNGSTYVPLRAISPAFNAPIDYDADTNTVILGKRVDGVNETSPLTAITFTASQKSLIAQQFQNLSGFKAYIPTKIVAGDKYKQTGSSEDSVRHIFNHMIIMESPRDYSSLYEGTDVALSNNVSAKWIKPSDTDMLVFKRGDTYISIFSEDHTLSKEQLQDIAASMVEL